MNSFEERKSATQMMSFSKKASMPSKYIGDFKQYAEAVSQSMKKSKVGTQAEAQQDTLTRTSTIKTTQSSKSIAAFSNTTSEPPS